MVDSGDDSVLVFSRTANGDVEPIRKLGGPKTKIRNIYGITVDSRAQPDHHRQPRRPGRPRVGRTASSSSIAPTTATSRRARSSPVRAPASSRFARSSSTRSAVRFSRRSRTTSRTTSSSRNVRRRGTRTRPGSSACGASTTTATCRRAASSRARPPDWCGRPASPSTRRDREVYAIDSVSNALFMFTMPELFKKPATVSGRFNR